MATNKALRAAPPKKLDNYVASVKKLFSAPFSVPDEEFLSKGRYVIKFGDFGNPSEGYSDYLPIGFNVTINNKTYKDFAVTTAGWMVLKDPDGGTTGATFWHDILDTAIALFPNYNNSIRSSFSNDHILLAPWFDTNIPIAETVDELRSVYPFYYSTKITAQVEQNILQGIDTRNWPYDLSDHGIRYLNSYDSKRGRYLLVRWTVSQNFYNNRLKFEVALYENGTIEYRYWPASTYEPSDSGGSNSYATIGIFWSSPTNGSNKFRDFSTLLDYDPKRKLSELGGSSYNPSYSETSLGSFVGPAQPYSSNVTYNNWTKNGGAITFSPPVNPGKFLPRKIISSIASTKHLTSPGGLFDDRKTVNFYAGGNVVVNMPSTLPSRLFGNTSEIIDVSLRQLLFTSGSLKVTSGSMKVGVIDSHLEVLDALAALQEPSKNSFNESQKNYQETAITSSFYATGSALEIFGDGFTTPLKSKTQFHFSLPVTKQITMPPSSASFYYYDVNKKMWSLVDPNGYKKPASSFSHYNEGTNLLFIKFRDSPGTDEPGLINPYFYSWPTYRIVETSRGFDAVGRKIVSGTNRINYTVNSGAWSPLSYQTDSAIGSLYNAISYGDSPIFAHGGVFFPGTQFLEESKSAITREYSNSVTDNIKFFPQKSQMFDFAINQPFLIEKIVVDVPFYINGEWFNDLTTCTRPFVDPAHVINNPEAGGRFIGPIDFGGPGITFAVWCARKGESNSYLDLIASGTITHVNDTTASVIIKKDPGMEHHCIRPAGFTSFSNPTCVLSAGTNNIFEGMARLEMEASVAGGLTFARNDRSYLTASYQYNGSPAAVLEAAAYVESNRDKAKFLLCSPEFMTRGETFANTLDRIASDVWVLSGPATHESTFEDYEHRSPRIYLQQVSPLSRGSAKINFNGNSILGGNIAAFNVEERVKNPLYTGYTKSELPSEYLNQINSSSFRFDAVSLYSTVDSRPSPYLMLPGDKLTISMSKTRPVIHKAKDSGTQFVPYAVFGGGGARYDEYILTGSHGTVMLNTGSINITVYGSYIQEGMEYHP